MYSSAFMFELKLELSMKIPSVPLKDQLFQQACGAYVALDGLVVLVSKGFHSRMIRIHDEKFFF